VVYAEWSNNRINELENPSNIIIGLYLCQVDFDSLDLR